MLFINNITVVYFRYLKADYSIYNIELYLVYCQSDDFYLVIIFNCLIIKTTVSVLIFFGFVSK